MADVVVEQCGDCGVAACTNVEVRQCGGSGVVAANDASMILIGVKTTVHHNCIKGKSDDYGLTVHGSSSSTIQLISPLTKENVSTDNAGGGNWGAFQGGDINQIKTIADTSSLPVLLLPMKPKHQVLRQQHHLSQMEWCVTSM